MRTKGAANWTPELEDELRVHWASGEPASRIAAMMGRGLTRNAVIGKASRMGLNHRKSPILPRLAPDDARARRNELQRQRRGSKPRQFKPHKPRAQKPPRLGIPLAQRKPQGEAWEPVPGVEPVSLLDLEAGQCKWPVGQDSPFMFCGAPATHNHYCEYHHYWSIGEGTASERAAIKAAKQATSFERFVPDREAA